MIRKLKWKKPLAVTLSVVIILGLAAGAFALSPGAAQSITDPSGSTLFVFGGRTWRPVTSGGGELTLASYDFSESRFMDDPDNENETFNWTSTSLYDYLNSDAFLDPLADVKERAIMSGGVTIPSYEEMQDGGLWGMSSANRVLTGQTYWLRSQGNTQQKAKYVDTGGVISLDGDLATDTNIEYGILPVIKIRQNRIVMISNAAATDKPGVSENAMTAIGSWVGKSRTMKLTVSTNDEDYLSLFVAGQRTQIKQPGNVVAIDYSNAKTGTGRAVSAVIVDENGDQLYYGCLVDCTSGNEAGQARMTLPADIADGHYTILLFNEEKNSANETDYASMPVEIALTIDTAPPEISTTSPADEATVVPVSTDKLSVRFNEKVNTNDDVKGTVTINKGAGLSTGYTWDDADTKITFDLSGLAHDTTYTVEVSGYQDLAGNMMESDYFIFTTAEPDKTKPYVAATNPASGDQNVPLDTAYLEITFDVDMNRSVIGSVSLDNQGAVSNGTWIQKDGHWRTIRYELSDLRGNTQYRITVSGFKNELGNEMEVDNTRTFRTEPADGDQTPPVVQAIEPAHGSTTVPISTNKLAVIFNEEMDIDANTGTVSIDNGAVVSLSAESIKWESTLKISYELLGLQYNTTYTLTISGFKDKAGNVMAPDQTKFFTTVKEDGGGGDPTPGPDPDLDKTPTILSTTPANSATVAATVNKYSITFSHAMDTASAGVISGNNGLSFTGLTWSNNNQTVEYTMNGLKAGTDYTVTISGFKHTGGLVMSQTARTFKTAPDGTDPNDTTKPTVASTDPASGSTVPYNQRKITITFSEAMDGSAGSVQITGGSLSNKLAGGTWESDGKTVVYDLPQLDYGTTYTLNISGYKDKAGNMLDADTARTILVSNTQYQVESPPVYSGSDTKFKVKEADYTKALGVMIKKNGTYVSIPADKIVFTSGSTVVELKSSYLTDLADGSKHDLRVLFTDGYADTTLSVDKSSNSNNSNNNSSNNSSNNNNSSSGNNSSSNGDKDNSNSGRD